jgi:hypothetical protein
MFIVLRISHTNNAYKKFINYHCNVRRPKTLLPVGIERGIFCFGGGRDDRFATPHSKHSSQLQITIWTEDRFCAAIALP